MQTPDYHTAIKLMLQGEQHSETVHNDNTIHNDCDECMRLAEAIVNACGLTTEEYLLAKQQRQSLNEEIVH